VGARGSGLGGEEFEVRGSRFKVEERERGRVGERETEAADELKVADMRRLLGLSAWKVTPY
jgi:hypothetical protein